MHGKEWFKRREDEPWASAECPGLQYDMYELEANFAAPKSGLDDSNEGPRLVVCGNSERRQTSWFQIFKSVHRAGVYVGITHGQRYVVGCPDKLSDSKFRPVSKCTAKHAELGVRK